MGKFLSVDPLTASYPFYTPYQFAGNKPVQAIDLDGLEEKVVVGDLYKLSVDMKNAPKVFVSSSGRVIKSTFNLYGYPRNNLYFWEKFISDYPNALDNWNKGRVLVEGKSPIVTNELKASFKQIDFDISHWKNGEIVEHHHVSQKSQSVPLSTSEHKKVKHLNIKSRLKNIGKGALSVTPAMLDLTGWYLGDPNSWFEWFDPSIELGKIEKDVFSGLYYTPVNIVKETTSEGVQAGTNFFNIYASYEWDEELRKYVGRDQVGYGYKYETESGSYQQVTFDMEGNPTGYESK